MVLSKCIRSSSANAAAWASAEDPATAVGREGVSAIVVRQLGFTQIITGIRDFRGCPKQGNGVRTGVKVVVEVAFRWLVAYKNQAILTSQAPQAEWRFAL